MSLSRQVLSSPFDIPAKPRVSPSTTTQGKRTKSSARNRETSLGRCVSNIMTDSRVVRRSPFGPSFEKDNPVVCKNAQTNRGQCIMFDSRLLRDNGSVFASPIVTVIEMDHMTNVHDENLARTTATWNSFQKKRSKQPISSKVHRNVHVQTDDHVAHDVSREKSAYADAGTQTDIHCLLDYDVYCDDATNSAENIAASSIDMSREAMQEEWLEERSQNDSKTSSEGVEKNIGDKPPQEVLAVDEDVNKENSPLDTLLTAPT